VNSRDLADEQQDDKDKDVDAEEAPKAASGKIVTCRLCKGNHMTFKCPFKDQLAALDQVEGENDPAAAGSSTSKAPGTGKYVPP
jgi:translation initiation factor 3 subunit G